MLERNRQILFHAVRTGLEAQEPSAIEGNYGPSGAAIEEAALREQEIWRSEAGVLTKRITPWMSAGLGNRRFLADYNYWRMAPYFELTEIVWLSVGIEPSDRFQVRIDQSARNDEQDVISLEFIARRAELIKRTFDLGVYGSRTKPDVLAEWVFKVGLDAHPHFLAMLTTLLPNQVGVDDNAFRQDSASDKAVNKTDQREVISMAKLLTAIAISEYGYDPTQRRSPIPTEIQSLADQLGLSVSKNTIRKYLQIGARYLPDCWKPDK